MGININHPSFIAFIGNVTDAVLSGIDYKNYFNLTLDKRTKVQKATLLLLKKSLKVRAFVNDTEIKAFIILLQKKNEEKENYEISAILKDLIVNYDNLSIKPEKKNISEKQSI